MYNTRMFLLHTIDSVTRASFEESRLTLTELSTMRCCTSLHVIQGLTDNTRAITPAAIGAAALVPECLSVHPLLPALCVTSVVTCRE